MDLSVVCSLLTKWILLVIIYSFLHILATKQTIGREMNSLLKEINLYKPKSEH